MEAQAAVAGWLAEERRLELKAFPVHVHRTGEACEILGWRVEPGEIRPGSTMRRRMPGKLREARGRGPMALARCVAAYRALWRTWESDRR